MRDREYWFAVSNGLDGSPCYLVIKVNRQPSEEAYSPLQLARQGKQLGNFLVNHCSLHTRKQLAKVLAVSG